METKPQKELSYITTPSFMKQNFRWNAAKYIGLYEPDNNLYLYKISLILIYDKQLSEHLKKDLGKNYDMIMRNFHKFYPQYQKLANLRELVLKSESRKEIKEMIEDEIKRESAKLQVFDVAVHCVFFHLLIRTDLRKLAVPSENILHAKDNTKTVRYGEERTDFMHEIKQESEEEKEDV